MKIAKKTIDEFLATKKVAIAGVSRDPKKFGHTIFKEMREKGFEVIPVNPNSGDIEGVTCYPSVAALPGDITRLIVLTRKPQTLEVLKEARQKGIGHVWIQQMSETKEALDFAHDNFESVIAGQCIMMFANPVMSVHKFHRTIKGIFGLLPK